MRYFVIGEDGQKYGPADVATLQNWIGEHRLLPTQQLEEEGSGIRLAASAVSGLNFPVADRPAPTPGPQGPGPQAPGPQAPTGPGYIPPPAGMAYQSYARNTGGIDDGKNDLTLAWVLGAFGICCLPLEIVGLVFAYRAESKLNPGAKAAKIFCWVILGLQIGVIIFRIIMIVGLVKSGAFNNPQSNPFQPH